MLLHPKQKNILTWLRLEGDKSDSYSYKYNVALFKLHGTRDSEAIDSWTNCELTSHFFVFVLYVSRRPCSPNIFYDPVRLLTSGRVLLLQGSVSPQNFGASDDVVFRIIMVSP